MLLFCTGFCTTEHTNWKKDLCTNVAKLHVEVLKMYKKLICNGNTESKERGLNGCFSLSFKK